MSEIITGSSSIEVSRTTKGDYSYSIKLYFSGNTISVMKGIVDRIKTITKYLESKIVEGIKDDEESREAINTT